MTAAKLTPPQLLRDVKAGHVYRSERGYDLYTCYDRAQANKKVTAIVERLSALGLVRIGEHTTVMQRPWHVTEQGEHVLSQQKEIL